MDVHSLNVVGEADNPVRIHSHPDSHVRSHKSRNRHHTDQSLGIHQVSDAPRDYLDDLADPAFQANLSYCGIWGHLCGLSFPTTSIDHYRSP